MGYSLLLIRKMLDSLKLLDHRGNFELVSSKLSPDEVHAICDALVKRTRVLKKANEWVLEPLVED